MKNEKKILALLGIAKKAGKTVSGTDMAVESVRSGKKSAVKLFVTAENASQNTVKRITNTSAYYGIPIVTVSDKATLGHTVGSTSEISTVGVTDQGLAEAMIKATQSD